MGQWDNRQRLLSDGGRGEESATVVWGWNTNRLLHWFKANRFNRPIIQSSKANWNVNVHERYNTRWNHLSSLWASQKPHRAENQRQEAKPLVTASISVIKLLHHNTNRNKARGIHHQTAAKYRPSTSRASVRNKEEILEKPTPPKCKELPETSRGVC